jgi:hypothetical protein
MNPSLLKVLVDRKIIRERTEIDATYRGHDLAGNLLVNASGTFYIVEIAPSDNGYMFTCVSTVDGRRRMIPGTAIVRIDGMCPTRLALNFDLSPEGVPLVVGKRRGRKPKNRLLVPVSAYGAA